MLNISRSIFKSKSSEDIESTALDDSQFIAYGIITQAACHQAVLTQYLRNLNIPY